MLAKFKRFRAVLSVYLLTIVGSMIVFAIALWLVKQYIVEHSFAIVDGKAMQARRSHLIENFAQLKTDAATAAPYAEKIKLLLPAEDELINFPGHLEGLARVHSVGYSFSFQGSPIPGDEKTPGYVAFALGAEGSMQHIHDFLESLQGKASRFLVSFGGFELTNIGEGKYRVSSPGKVYFHTAL